MQRPFGGRQRQSHESTARPGGGEVGIGCTKLCGCSTATGFGNRYDKFKRYETVHIPELNTKIYFLHDPSVDDPSRLRASSSRRNRPPRRRAAEERDALAALHLVTSIGRHVGGGAIRATKQDIGQRAIRTPLTAIRIVEIRHLRGTCPV